MDVSADRGPIDRDFINLTVESEVQYWTQLWRVSRQQLASAIEKVGVMAKDVARELGKPIP